MKLRTENEKTEMSFVFTVADIKQWPQIRQSGLQYFGSLIYCLISLSQILKFLYLFLYELEAKTVSTL